jgi:hypothetical protein
MSSLQQDLDAIAAMQGKSIPPGNYIEGGGNWPQADAALPGERFQKPAADTFDDEDDERQPDFDSPLIPRQPKHMDLPVATEPAPENLDNFRAPDMTILGNDDAAYIAAYQGRQVELSKVEAAAVRKVVLQAIKRTIMLQLHDVDALLPKRKRNRIPDSPKKRGRPRKVTE